MKEMQERIPQKKDSGDVIQSLKCYKKYKIAIYTKIFLILFKVEKIRIENPGSKSKKMNGHLKGHALQR